MFKALVPDPDDQGVILVRGVPFGNQTQRDLHGQYFTSHTNFLSHVLPLPPVFHFHGAKSGSLADQIGETLTREQRDDGIWYRARLFIDSVNDTVRQKAVQLWEAAKAGRLFASSGAVEATIKVAGTGEILQWLVGELSLIDTRNNRETPANFHATVQPIKADLENIETGNQTLDDLSLPTTKRGHYDKEDDYEDKGDYSDDDDRRRRRSERAGLLEDDEEMQSVDQAVSSYVENMYHQVRAAYPSDGQLREMMLTTFRQMFGREMNPDIRSAKMSDNNEAVVLLQQQVADLTQRLAAMPELQTQIQELTGQVQARDGEINRLQGIVSTKSAEAAMGQHVGLVDTWIREGRITPAERERVLEVLSFAYQADMSTKGDVGFVNSIKGWIEERPVQKSFGVPATVYSNAGALNGGAVGNPDLEINPEHVDRLKRYAEIPAQGG